MMFKKVIVLIFGLVITFFLSACDKEGSKSPPKEIIKVGVIYPLSGPNATTGEDLKAGVELASEIINRNFEFSVPLAKGEGFPSQEGLKIEILYRDSQSDPNLAANWVEKLINEDHVKAIMGCYSSTVTAAASERAEIMNIPFLNAASTSPTLTQRGFKWFFRTTPNDEMFVQNFFTFLADLSENQKIEVPKRLFLVYENRLWGTSVARVERNLSIKYDWEIIEELPYDSKRTSFEKELKRIKLFTDYVMLQTSYARDAVLYLKGYKAYQINPIAILAMNAGFISPYFLKNLGKDGEYILSREVWALDLGQKKPLVTKINDLFLKRFGRNMTGNSARSFTGLLVLADSINRAISLEPTKIREALLASNIRSDQLIMPWDGVKFDHQTGQNLLGSGIIVQIQKGKYVTVWPSGLSSSDPIWPMPPWSKREKVK